MRSSFETWWSAVTSPPLQREVVDRKSGLLPPIQVEIDALGGVGVPTSLSGDREGREDRILRIDLVPDGEPADRLSHGRLDRRLVGPGVFREEGMFGIGNLRLDDLHVACNMFHLIFKMTASDRIRGAAGGNGSHPAGAGGEELGGGQDQ